MSIRVPMLDVTAQCQGKVPALLKPEGKSKSTRDLSPQRGCAAPGASGNGVGWGLEHGDPQEQGWDGLWDWNVGNRHRNRSRAALGAEERLGTGWHGEKWGPRREGRGGMGWEG